MVLNRYKYKILSLMLIISYAMVFSIAYGAKSKKADAPTLFAQAQEAFLNYDFELAEELAEQYESLMSRSKKPIPEEFEVFQRQLEVASRAFNSVQQIEVTDTIRVPREEFFKMYKLARSAGKIGEASSFGLRGLETGNEVSFINETGDYFITPVMNEEEIFVLKENRRLLDGTWHTQDMLGEVAEMDGDFKYPFLSGDGQTFYFANNGEESMGGYDLFVVQKQPLTGETLQPLNLGMPFNSPYDDFMMAIDEENGKGWWASDRNSPGGDITIYVYKLSDIRKNYPTDTEDLVKHAKLSY